MESSGASSRRWTPARQRRLGDGQGLSCNDWHNVFVWAGGFSFAEKHESGFRVEKFGQDAVVGEMGFLGFLPAAETPSTVTSFTGLNWPAYFAAAFSERGR